MWRRRGWEFEYEPLVFQYRIDGRAFFTIRVIDEFAERHLPLSGIGASCNWRQR